MDAALSNLEEPESGKSDSEKSASGKGLESSSANTVQTSLKCPHCGTGMHAGAAFCPGCAWSMAPIPAAERAAAAVAYFTFIAGMLILLLPRRRSFPFLPVAVVLFLAKIGNSRFVRFHAWQSILLWGVFFFLTIAALVLSNLAAAMLFLLFGILASLAMFFLWIVLSVKAWEGERFELPLFGQLAAKIK